jgi:hypothetical protein
MAGENITPFLTSLAPKSQSATEVQRSSRGQTTRNAMLSEENTQQRHVNLRPAPAKGHSDLRRHSAGSAGNAPNRSENNAKPAAGLRNTTDSSSVANHPHSKRKRELNSSGLAQKYQRHRRYHIQGTTTHCISKCLSETPPRSKCRCGGDVRVEPPPSHSRTIPLDRTGKQKQNCPPYHEDGCLLEATHSGQDVLSISSHYNPIKLDMTHPVAFYKLYCTTYMQAQADHYSCHQGRVDKTTPQQCGIEPQP